VENLIVEIGANTKEFLAGLSEVGDKTEQLGDRLKSIGAIAATAFAGYTAAIMGSVYAYREEEKIGQSVQAILQATGGVAGVTAEAINEYAESLSKATTFSKDQVKRGEEILLTFTRIGKDVFPDATKATLDLAQRMGGDSASAAQMLGRALQDPMAGLQRLSREGILFTAQQKAQIETMQLSGNIAGAQTIILKQLESQYGGLAQAAAGGTGTIAQLKNISEDFAQKIGAQFAPYVGAAAAKLRDLIAAAAENQGLVEFAAAALTAGAVISGGIAALIAGAIAFKQLAGAVETARIVIQAIGLTTRAAVGATGIGLLLIVAYEVYEHWSTLWPAMVSVYKTFVSTITNASQGLSKVIRGVFSLDLNQIKEGIAQATAAFVEGAKQTGHTVAGLFKASPEAAQNAAEMGRQLADAEAKARQQQLMREEDQTHKLQLAAQKASDQALVMEFQGHTAKVVALKKAEAAALKQLADANFKGDRKALQKHLTEVEADLTKAQKTEEKQRVTFNKLMLKSNAEFTTAEKAQIIATIQTEETARNQQAIDDFNRQIQSENTLLADKQKYGEAYALLDQAMHTKIAEGTGQAFSSMEQMTQSHHETLKAAGKVAALANIARQTVQAAMDVYAGFCTIPIVGAAIGVIAAGLTVAYGAEKAAEVQAMAQGGVVGGGVPNVDSVPIMAQPGELVVPQRNFDQVVSDAAARRAGLPLQSQGAQSQPVQVRVVVELKGNASRMLQVQAVQDQAMGVYRGT
jgi:hypothetical protein